MQKFLDLICAVFILVAASCTSSAGVAVIADIDPFELGKVEADFNKIIGTDLHRRIIEVFYHARTDEICLHYKHLGSKFELYLKPEGRNAVIKAIENYHNDFDNRKLASKNSKTSKAYGKIKLKQKWGVFSASSEARPIVYLGYRFNGENPYFALNIREAATITKAEDGEKPESIHYIIWMNKLQSKMLADFISREGIDAGLATQNLPENLNSGPDKY